MLIYYFKKKLGSPELWNYLLAIPIIPALIGAFLLLVFFPETPKALLIKGNDGAATECKKAIFSFFFSMLRYVHQLASFLILNSIRAFKTIFKHKC